MLIQHFIKISPNGISQPSVYDTFEIALFSFSLLLATDKQRLRLNKFVDTKDNLGETALYLAARAGSIEIARLLVFEGKADVDLPTNQMA